MATGFDFRDMFKGATSEETDDKARRAVAAFRGMQPTLSAYAQMITGRPEVRVVAHPTSNGMTDGTKVYYRPPIALGDAVPHQRNLCDKRGDLMTQRCPACAVREEVLAGIYHEISHIANGSFKPPTSDELGDIVVDLGHEFGFGFGVKVAERVKAHPGYSNISVLVSPFMHMLWNAVEDSRIDSAMFAARPGTKIMFDAAVLRTMERGFETKTPLGGVAMTLWHEQPLNSQVILGVFLLTSDYAYRDYLDSRVVEALDDAQIQAMTKGAVVGMDSAADSFRLAFQALVRLRQLGFLKSDDDPEEDKKDDDPREEERTDEASNEGSSEGTESSTSTNESGDNEAGEESSEQDSEGPGSGEGVPESDGDTGSDPSADADGQGSDDSDTDDDAPGGDSDDATGDGTADDDASGNSSASESDADAADYAGEPGSDDESGSSDGDRGGDSGGDSDDGSEGDAEGNDSEDRGSDGDGSGNSGGTKPGRDGRPSREAGSTPEADHDDSPESGEVVDATPEAGDSDESGESSDTGEVGSDTDIPEAGDSASDGADESAQSSSGADSTGDPSSKGEHASTDVASDSGLDGDIQSDASDEGTPGRDESDPVSGENGDLGGRDAEDDQSASDDSNGDGAPIDSGAAASHGTRLINESEEVDGLPEDMGDARDAEATLIKLHEDEIPYEVDLEQSKAETKAIDRAIIQSVWFETPSRNVLMVREHKYGQPTTTVDGQTYDIGWPSEGMGRRGRAMLGIEGEFDPAEAILGPALLRMRVAFADNKRSAMDRNRKSGRVDARVLGRRAWKGDDDRLFGKRIIPKKKDYFVIIGVDISGSTIGENIMLAKKAAFAQAELCHRMGIGFALYCHTGEYHNGANYNQGIDVEILLVKTPEDPWNEEAKHRLREIGPKSANLDGHTIEYYRKLADSRPETHTVIMYYTDGKMPAENADEELVILQREIKECRRRGHTLVGVGIRTDSPREHGLDTVEVNEDADIVKVVRRLEQRLETV